MGRGTVLIELQSMPERPFGFCQVMIKKRFDDAGNVMGVRQVGIDLEGLRDIVFCLRERLARWLATINTLDQTAVCQGCYGRSKYGIERKSRPVIRRSLLQTNGRALVE